jgi:hypothetical protein
MDYLDLDQGKNHCRAPVRTILDVLLAEKFVKLFSNCATDGN